MFGDAPSYLCLIPKGDTVTLADDGMGGMTVSFKSGTNLPLNECAAPPIPAEYTTQAIASADSCMLTLESHLYYCYFEAQCEHRILTLSISGDTITGTLSYKSCWCPDVDTPPAIVDVTGTRVQ